MDSPAVSATVQFGHVHGLKAARFLRKKESIHQLVELNLIVSNRRSISQSVLLAELFAHTDRLLIVATLMGSLKLKFLALGGRGKSSSAAALGGTFEGNELKLAVSTQFRFLGNRNEERSEWLADRLKTEDSLGDFDNNCL